MNSKLRWFLGFVFATLLIAFILAIDWIFWKDGDYESKMIISIVCPIFCYLTIPIMFYGLFED